MRKALSEADPYAVAAAVAAGQAIPIMVAGQAVELAAEDVLVQAEPKPGYQVTNDAQRGIVARTTTVPVDGRIATMPRCASLVTW